MNFISLVFKIESLDIVLKFPQAIASSLIGIINSCVSLIKASLLIGRSLDVAVELFVAIVESPIPKKPSFEDLMTELSSPVYGSEKPSRQVSVAVAVILSHATKANNDNKATEKLLKGLLESLKQPVKNESLQVFALYALGEIGRVYPQAFDLLKIR
jgi:hypothetical protein